MLSAHGRCTGVETEVSVQLNVNAKIFLFNIFFFLHVATTHTNLRFLRCPLSTVVHCIVKLWRDVTLAVNMVTTTVNPIVIYFSRRYFMPIFLGGGEGAK